ncbi:restriction endonuclease subunit S [Salmonella enterica]|uniref:restriction endonuclease subunit S n=2 Tax=Salmonella TaxID=590 RepID=UPI00127CD173|nr:restriction endonuclease subunit S [Salmonella enterica subsp. enterica]ECJ5888823.1 restriction endonuclease subunit S [Salmonella enterica subsp. salamae]EME8537124.1 restriction endonuclease subunit S [Salmonella enterica]MDV2055559.1 restriction endonuclease subunit S [Salmonella enterica]HAV0412782.1 restriction endonuclease subunit S [Salmonella enterica]
MVNNEWVSTTLGELVDTFGGSVQTGPFGSQLHAADYVSEGIPSVMPKNIRIEEIDVEDIARISLSDAERLKKYQLAEGDIVYSRRGDVEKCALVTKNEANWLCGTGCLRIRISKNKSITPYFLHAFLSTPVTREWVSRHAIGATMPNLNTSILRDVPIVVPPFDSMNFIGAMWIKLNRKIILNRKINQTLEQMSQTLFKSWFVDFDPVIDNALDAGNPIPEALQSRAELRQKVRNSADFKPLPADIRALFPAEFEETELGWVPNGWITTSFNDLIELIGGGTPKTSVEEYWNGDIPWFSVVDAPNESDVYVLATEKNITTEGLNNSSAKLLRIGTTIISARGTVGKCAMVAVPMAMNQSCYGVIGKNNISDEYIYFQLKNAVQTLQQMGHGSVFNTITRDTFKNIKVPFCNEELTNSYSLLVKNYFSKILNNNYQNIALTNLRDTLLPKLISGELSLEDLPDLVNQTEPA